MQYCARKQSAIDNVQAHNISTITYARYVRTDKRMNAAHSLGTKFSNVLFHSNKEQTIQGKYLWIKTFYITFCHCFYPSETKRLKMVDPRNFRHQKLGITEGFLF